MKTVIKFATLMFSFVSCPLAAQVTWEQAPDLPAPRQEIYAAEHSRQIWLVGGMDAAGAPTSTVFRLSQGAETWEEMPGLPVSRHHVAVGATSDALYGVGGFTGTYPDWRPSEKSFRYDFASQVWNRIADLPEPRGEHVTAAVGNRIYIVGGRLPMAPGAVGYDNLRDSATALVYDPQTDAWEHVASPSVARNSAASAVIDERIYIVGGRSYEKIDDGTWLNVNSDVLEMYDPRTDRWETLAPMPQPQGGLAAAAFDGKLYVFGGEQWTPEEKVFGNAWVYDPKSSQWSSLPPMITPRHGLAAASLVERILVFGGSRTAGSGAVVTSEALRVADR